VGGDHACYKVDNELRALEYIAAIHLQASVNIENNTHLAACLAELVHEFPPLRQCCRGWVQACLQHCASVQVQRPEAHLALTKLLLNGLALDGDSQLALLGAKKRATGRKPYIASWA
jgi:hypothetical protein